MEDEEDEEVILEETQGKKYSSNSPLAPPITSKPSKISTKTKPTKTTLASKQYQIRGVTVDFPFEAYDCQLIYMERVIQSLQEVRNCNCN